jgi:hypothetical protein
LARFTSADANSKTLHVGMPWRVVPDASSTVVVMNGLVDTIFVNNQETDCDKGLHLYYAGAINNIVDRHVCRRSLEMPFIGQVVEKIRPERWQTACASWGTLMHAEQPVSGRDEHKEDGSQ